LRDSIYNTTQSPVDDVMIEVIPATMGRGYVKCLIPASDLLPHRAMIADGQYWRRKSTGGFRKMEHYELEEVFGRRRCPVLRLHVILKPEPGDNPNEVVIFSFLNEGRGLAHHAGFLCNIGDGEVIGLHGSRLDNAPILNERPSVSFYSPQDVIHPNGIYNTVGHAIIRRQSKSEPLPIGVTWYADNMKTKSANVILQPGKSQLLKGSLLTPPQARDEEG
jgi:hypothetical protein